MNAKDIHISAGQAKKCNKIMFGANIQNTDPITLAFPVELYLFLQGANAQSVDVALLCISAYKDIIKFKLKWTSEEVENALFQLYSYLLQYLEFDFDPLMLSKQYSFNLKKIDLN